MSTNPMVDFLLNKVVELDESAKKYKKLQKKTEKKLKEAEMEISVLRRILYIRCERCGSTAAPCGESLVDGTPGPQAFARESFAATRQQDINQLALLLQKVIDLETEKAMKKSKKLQKKPEKKRLKKFERDYGNLLKVMERLRNSTITPQPEDP
uniref:Rabenosyn-5 n=1 Tax=Steinernema glaseri TaxID=37863 RepID=A0A1I7Y9K7_9BILA